MGTRENEKEEENDGMLLCCHILFVCACEVIW